MQNRSHLTYLTAPSIEKNTKHTGEFWGETVFVERTSWSSLFGLAIRSLNQAALGCGYILQLPVVSLQRLRDEKNQYSIDGLCIS